MDKYTLKSKLQKQTMQQFMKTLIDISLVKSQKSKKTAFDEDDILNQDIEIHDPSVLGGNKKETPTTFFDVMLDYCFFENDDEPAKVAADMLKATNAALVDDSILRVDKGLQFRSP